MSVFDALQARVTRLSRRGKALAALAVVVVVALLAAGGVFGYGALFAPTTVSLNLKTGASEVGLERTLVFTFSRQVRFATVEQGLRITPAIEGTLQGSKTTFSWVPSEPWKDLTAYTVRMAPAHDATGHAVVAGIWRFTTTIVPRVTSVSLAGGASLAEGAQVPLGSSLTITFNEAMETSTVSILVNSSAAKLTWGASGKAATLSLAGIHVGALSLALAPGARDPGGRPAAAWKLGANVVFQVVTHTVPLPYPAVIQIPNDAGAWDQSGLQSASVVFQYLAEGGITRMSALFSDIPDLVGPIRSGRLISFKITKHYGGRLYLSGLSQPEFQVLYANPFPTWFESNGGMFRSPSRYAPDNLYIQGSSVLSIENSHPVAASVIQKSSQVPITSGPQVASFSVPEHNSTYTYDPVTGTYEKTDQGHLMSDASLGQPLRISMVIVLQTTETVMPNMVDVNGAHSLDFDLETTGPAQFYYQGFSAAGSWASVGANLPLKFTLSGGQTVPFPPGLVWIDVVSR